MKIDIKTMISIIVATATLGGFYYTTKHRLDLLESNIIELKADIAKVRKIANRKNKK